jgi:hypothetical protein
MIMEIERKYVSFEQAKKLKEKEFNVNCLAVYNDSENRICYAINDIGNLEFTEKHLELTKNYGFNNSFLAPEHWQVIEWLRINHNIWIYTRPVLDEDGEWMFKCYVKLMNAHKAKEYQTALERKPEESISRAIDYVLEKLI